MSNVYIGQLVGFECERVRVEALRFDVPDEGFAVRVWFKAHDGCMVVDNACTYSYEVEDSTFECEVDNVHDMAIREFDHQWSKASEQARECDEGMASVSLIVVHEGWAVTELECKTRKHSARKGE